MRLCKQLILVITLRPILKVGDIDVVDNLAVHHGEVERALGSFLNDLGMELVFLLVYTDCRNYCAITWNTQC